MAQSRRFDELAQMRRATGSARGHVRQLERAMRNLERRLVRAVQQEARAIQRDLVKRYESGRYAGRNGRVRRIRSYSAAHRRRKRVLRLDLRRGIMRKGVLKQLKSPQSIDRHHDGFTRDFKRPNITVTGRATVGKSRRNIAGKRLIGGRGSARQVIGTAIRSQVTSRRSFRVNDYIDHFVRQKAPGLGSLSNKDRERIRAAWEREYRKWFTELRESLKRSVRGRNLFRLELELKGLSKPKRIN